MPLHTTNDQPTEHDTPQRTFCVGFLFQLFTLLLLFSRLGLGVGVCRHPASDPVVSSTCLDRSDFQNDCKTNVNSKQSPLNQGGSVGFAA